MKNKPTFQAFKKLEDGRIFVQFKKNGKFVEVDPELAEFVIFFALDK